MALLGLCHHHVGISSSPSRWGQQRHRGETDSFRVRVGLGEATNAIGRPAHRADASGRVKRRWDEHVVSLDERQADGKRHCHLGKVETLAEPASGPKPGPKTLAVVFGGDPALDLPSHGCTCNAAGGRWGVEPQTHSWTGPRQEKILGQNRSIARWQANEMLSATKGALFTFDNLTAPGIQ